MVTSSSASSDGDETETVAGLFWSDVDGSVAAINNTDKTDKFVRLEKFRPHIYAAEVKNVVDVDGTGWVLVKIGFSQRENSPQEKVELEKDVAENLQDNGLENPKIEMIFNLPQAALDTRTIRELESAVREKVGHKLPKELAKELRLPFVTDWVLTNSSQLEKLQKDHRKNVATISSVFDAYNRFTTSLPKMGLTLVNGDFEVSISNQKIGLKS